MQHWGRNRVCYKLHRLIVAEKRVEPPLHGGLCNGVDSPLGQNLLVPGRLGEYGVTQPWVGGPHVHLKPFPSSAGRVVGTKARGRWFEPR